MNDNDWIDSDWVGTWGLPLAFLAGLVFWAVVMWLLLVVMV